MDEHKTLLSERAEQGAWAAPWVIDEIRKLEAALETPGIEVLAALAAAISLLKRGGIEAAPSKKMGAQMITDYEKALEQGRAVTAAERAVAKATTYEIGDV